MLSSRLHANCHNPGMFDPLVVSYKRTALANVSRVDGLRWTYRIDLFPVLPIFLVHETVRDAWNLTNDRF